MIPANRLSPRAVNNLMEYLRYEISQAESERRELEEKWLKIHRDYDQIPEQPYRDFPFVGAANFVAPIIATDVDIIFSRLMGTLFGPENLWSVQPLRPDMIQFAKRLQEFLQWAQKNELRVYDAVRDFTLELCKLGTSVLKTRYRREMKRVFNFRETPFGTIEEHQDILLHDHPQVDWVSIFDFLVPSLATKGIQEAAWCAERIRQDWSQIVNRVRSGIYDPAAAERIRTTGNSTTWYQQQLLTQGLIRPGLSQVYETRDVWLDYDISDGVYGPEALVCTIHLPTMTYLRIDYNPYFDQERPYDFARFLVREGRFYGLGLGEMLEQTQEEITTTRRQRTDNSTLSNAPMMVTETGNNIKQDEPIFPGRWVIVNDATKVVPLNMGRPIDTTQYQEATSLQMASRRTGVNDYIAGDFSPAMGYSTATVGVQNLQEAAKRFDQTMREVRNALGAVGTRVVGLYQQYNTNGKEFLALGPVDGSFVQQVLQFPLDMIRACVGVELTATSASFNKEVEIRTNTIIMQMLNQFYQQSIQAMGIAMNPQVPPPMRQMALLMIASGSILLRRILDTYGMQDADRLVPEMEALLGQRAQQIGSFGGAQPFGVPAGPGLPGPSGMGLAPAGGFGAPAPTGQNLGILG